MKKIKTIESMVNIAINMKPKNRIRTKETRIETINILAKLIRETQKKLIGYRCLQAAVRLSKENLTIMEKAQELIMAKVEKMTKG